MKQNGFTPNRAKLNDIVAPLLSWYSQNKRVLPWRENTDPYRVWVSEIMLQQTRVDTVIPYYLRFLAALPTVQDLAAADEALLLSLWEGLGYYSRVRNMQKAARQIVEQFGGIFPSDEKDVGSLCGIGPYTVGAICSIAFEKATPAVDGNVLRVISRICENGTDITDTAYKKAVANQLAAIYPPVGNRGNFTQSLMELGAVVCTPNGAPKCNICPVYSLCKAGQNGSFEKFPTVPPKPEKRQQNLTVFRLCYGQEVALQKRPENGLLAGMWQLPNVAEKLTPKGVENWLKEHNIAEKPSGKPLTQKHIFTHIQWQMTCYTVQCGKKYKGFVWGKTDGTKGAYPLPTAFKKLLK